MVALWPSFAWATCNGQFPVGNVCGNAGTGQATPDSWSMTAIIDSAFGNPSQQGQILNRGSSTWSATMNPVLGNPGVSNGSLGLAGATSGTVTIAVSAATSSWIFTVPTSPGTSGQALFTDGTGATSWKIVSGAGTVTSVAEVVPGEFTISGSPITSAGTLTIGKATQSATLFWGGPTSGGAAAQPTFRAVGITDLAFTQSVSANLAFAGPVSGAAGTASFRALIGADLPLPTSSTLGGIESFASVAHQWINAISVSGVPSATQPAFSDISGTAAANQLPAPTLTSLGAVFAINSVSHQWVNAITSGTGVPTLSQPAFSDISGTIGTSQLPAIPNNNVIANTAGFTTQPVGTPPSTVLDIFGSAQGDILYRASGGNGWQALGPGTSGQVLVTSGASGNPFWASISGTGTVTLISTGSGLSGGPISGSGTISLATIASGTVLANTATSSAVPSGVTPSAVLDLFGSAIGDTLYRASGATGWTVLAPGTLGQVLQTQGAASTPQWATVVSSVIISGGTGISATGTCTIASGGACTVTPILQGFLGGLVLSNDATSANTTLDIASGQTTSDDVTTFMGLTSNYTKTTGSWAVGTGNGGLDTGAISASTWYHVFVIERTDTGVVDVLFSKSATSPTFPANYTEKRRIGSFKTDASSHILAFTQVYDTFIWTAPVSPDISSSISATPTLFALAGVPTGVKVTAKLRGGMLNQNTNTLINSPDESAVSGGSIGDNFTWEASSVLGGSGELMIGTNTSAQIRAVATSTNTLFITTVGWRDTRGM